MKQVNQHCWALWSDEGVYHNACWALWSDEGVYHNAKELLLLFPSQFENIFLGLGSFHTTKIIINCLRQYLGDSGITEALIERGIWS